MPTKICLVKAMVFSSGRAWMWESACAESWAPKNWYFWTIVLEKIFESPLDCKEIQPVHPKNQSWVLIGRTDAEAENPVLWPPQAKCWLIGKYPDAGRHLGQEDKGTTRDEIVGWHHRLDGHGSELSPGVGDGQGDLACWDSWGCKESDTTEWTELNWCLMLKKWPCVLVLNWISETEFWVKYEGTTLQLYQAKRGTVGSCLWKPSPKPGGFVKEFYSNGSKGG